MNIKKILLSIWELPQNIVGWIVMKSLKTEYCLTYKDATIYTWYINGGMSLGRYIFVPFLRDELRVNDVYQEHYIKHEYGHSVQSKYLGWLYLLVIGLPSLIWAWCFEEYRRKTNTSYYSFYTESWANKLGEVQAEE